MRVVWKFPLFSHHQSVKAPGLGRPLHAAAQDGHPVLWAEVDTDVEPRTCIVHIAATGQSVPDNVDHVATYIDGPLVWHVYTSEPVA